MKQPRIVRHDPEQDKDQTDRKRVQRLSGKEIAEAAAADPDAAPLLSEQWFKQAKVVPPVTKKGVFLRLDPDILGWFKRQGPRYQTRMNAALRAFMEAHGSPTEKRPARAKPTAR